MHSCFSAEVKVVVILQYAPPLIKTDVVCTVIKEDTLIECFSYVVVGGFNNGTKQYPYLVGRYEIQVE